MSLNLGKPNMPPSQPRKDKERETREAIVQDADKTEGKDRDLVHGDGGTLGLGGRRRHEQGRLKAISRMTRAYSARVKDGRLDGASSAKRRAAERSRLVKKSTQSRKRRAA